jgi:tetratricopeptide (TPR) repeat protein
MKKINLIRLSALLLSASLCLSQSALAQRAGEDEEKEAAPTIDQRTGEVLNEAIEFLGMDKYDEAQAVLGELQLDRLSPYERGRVEQILANIEYSKDNYPASRAHMQAAIDSGGLNVQEMDQMAFQIAQMFMAEENWTEGAKAMEAWISSAAAPNSSAYYLLAVAYYQMENFDKSLPNAQKAVDLTEVPQETWLQLLQALLLQKEDYAGAEKVLKQIINLYPEKKTYWVQLSSVYAALDDLENALTIMQLANHAGLLNESSDFLRLAELMTAQNTPVRAANLLTDKIDSGVIEGNLKVYEQLSNSWIAAREYRKALPVLDQAAELDDNGELFVRIGDVNIQLEEWDAAVSAYGKALDKGGLKDTGTVHLMLGIANYNQEKFDEAKRWFERAASSEKNARNARAYLQLIESR